jgi:hypothetical protein
MQQNQLFNDMAELFEQDSMEEATEKEVPRNEKLKELAALIDKMQKHELEMQRLSKLLAAETEKYNKINTLMIPDLFEELGLKKISLSNGRTVEIKSSYVGSITEDRKPQCFEWLENKGYDSIIKHDVISKFKKGETAEHDNLVKVLMDLGVTFEDKKYVHPQTLKSFIREQLESGADFPQELFGVVAIRKTVVK